MHDTIPAENYRIVCSTYTMERARIMVSEYYFGSTITLTPVTGNIWLVSTGKGLCKNVRLRLKGQRYRLEIKEV